MMQKFRSFDRQYQKYGKNRERNFTTQLKELPSDCYRRIKTEQIDHELTQADGFAVKLQQLERKNN